MEFRTIEPKILYFGTPVALISSVNEDGSTNLAPMSSFWALGWTLVLGLLDETKTAENFERHPECVVNLPSPDMWRDVEKLAPLTGKILCRRSRRSSSGLRGASLKRRG
jgi:flavin reductase (DIM6/NTAB) family NADH-FMN oxidoreductase RutF